MSARTMGSTSEDSNEDGFYERDAETCESSGSEEKSASEDGDGVVAEQTRVGTGVRVSEGRRRRRRLRRAGVYSDDDTNIQVPGDGRSPIHSRLAGLGRGKCGERLGDERG